MTAYPPTWEVLDPATRDQRDLDFRVKLYRDVAKMHPADILKLLGDRMTAEQCRQFQMCPKCKTHPQRNYHRYCNSCYASYRRWWNAGKPEGMDPFRFPHKRHRRVDRLNATGQAAD